MLNAFIYGFNRKARNAACFNNGDKSNYTSLYIDIK